MLCDRLSKIENNQETILAFLRHEHLRSTSGLLDAKLLGIRPCTIRLELSPEHHPRVQVRDLGPPSLKTGELQSCLLRMECNETCIYDDAELYKLMFPEDDIPTEYIIETEPALCVAHGITSELRYVSEEAQLRRFQAALNRDLFRAVEIVDNGKIVISGDTTAPELSSIICIAAVRPLPLVDFIREAIRLYESIGHTSRCMTRMDMAPVWWPAIEASRLIRVHSLTPDGEEKREICEKAQAALLVTDDDSGEVKVFNYLKFHTWNLVDRDWLEEMERRQEMND